METGKRKGREIMSKTKKEKKQEDKHEKVVGKLLKLLAEEYPGSPVASIHALRQAMMIYFKALSIAECSDEKRDKLGKELIHETHKEFKRFVDYFHEDLLKAWEEDKKEENQSE